MEGREENGELVRECTHNDKREGGERDSDMISFEKLSWKCNRTRIKKYWVTTVRSSEFRRSSYTENRGNDRVPMGIELQLPCSL